MSKVKYTEEEIIRGDGRKYEIIVTDDDGDVVNISGAKIWFTVKKGYEDTDANAIFQLDSDTVTEIEITDAVAGKAVIYIKASDTSGLAIRSYFFDIQIVETGREPRTLIIGMLIVRVDVTLSII